MPTQQRKPASTYQQQRRQLIERIADFFRDGYSQESPSKTVEHLDQEVAASLRCSCCRKRGMEFMPFRKDQIYRGLAYCAECGHHEEM